MKSTQSNTYQTVKVKNVFLISVISPIYFAGTLSSLNYYQLEWPPRSGFHCKEILAMIIVSPSSLPPHIPPIPPPLPPLPSFLSCLFLQSSLTAKTFLTCHLAVGCILPRFFLTFPQLLFWWQNYKLLISFPLEKSRWTWFLGTE